MAKCGCSGESGACSCNVQGGGGVIYAESTPGGAVIVQGVGSAVNPFLIDLSTNIDTSGYAPVITGLNPGTVPSIAVNVRREGKQVWLAVVITLTAGFAFSGDVTVGLPSAYPLPRTIANYRMLGLLSLYDLSATAAYAGLIQGNVDAVSVRLRSQGANGLSTQLTAAVPFTWAVGDVIALEFQYMTP